jgi:dolichol-phosphate mannosyltransferase
MTLRPNQFLLSIVVPCYNEEAVIELTHSRLAETLGTDRDFHLEMVYVDDGSQDKTMEILAGLQKADNRVRVLQLSRNFGHQAAVSAGMAHVSGDVVCIIDGDLQDPPEFVLDMLMKWQEGFDVVYGVRHARKEGFLKRAAYSGFYRLWRWIANIEVPLDSGDFCLMDRRVVDVINDLPEKNRFIRGLRAWSGLRAARAAGTPKYTVAKLIKLAWDGIFNFSVAPLRMISMIGVATSAFSAICFAFVIAQRLIGFRMFNVAPQDVPGWTSIVLIFLMVGGIQLFCLGIIGEYIGRLYEEVKGRPTYLIRRYLGFKEVELEARNVGDVFQNSTYYRVYRRSDRDRHAGRSGAREPST